MRQTTQIPNITAEQTWTICRPAGLKWNKRDWTVHYRNSSDQRHNSDWETPPCMMNNQFTKKKVKIEEWSLPRLSCSTKACIHHFYHFQPHDEKPNVVIQSSGHVRSDADTPSLPLYPLPPYGTLGWRVLCLHHPKLWQVAVIWKWTPLLHPKSAGWLAGLPVDPPPPPMQAPKMTQPTPFTFSLSPDLLISNWFEELLLCTFSSTLHTGRLLLTE